MTSAVRIEVVYSPQARAADLRELTLPTGATVAEAIEASGLRACHRELGEATLLACGVWGRACRLDRPLTEGDRVELYRPLLLDPKEARRQRGREKKSAKPPPRASESDPLSGTGSA